jgi:putative glutamine amidotransferase
MPRPLVGVSDTDSPKVRNYVSVLEDLGARVEVLDWRVPRSAALDVARLDAVVLCGGDDVDASHFGETNHTSVVLDPPARDRYELELAAVAVREDVPLLAVCRGLQVLNVALGGTVDQHVPDTPGRAEHAGGAEHLLHVAEGSLLAGFLGRGAVPASVNSYHHQAVGVVAERLTVSATAPDGLVEAVEGPGAYCLGVQWHPERNDGDARLGRPLFEGLIAAARRRNGN